MPEDDCEPGWTRDDQGRRCKVGLTHAETEELSALRALRSAVDPRARARRTELQLKHDLADRRALGDAIAARTETKH